MIFMGLFRSCENKVGRLARGGKNGGIGVAADDGRHERGVDDSEAARSPNSQIGTQDRFGIAIMAHLAGADRMIAGLDRALAVGRR